MAITILNSRKGPLRRLAADGSPLNFSRNFRIGVERRVVTIDRGPRSGCILLPSADLTISSLAAISSSRRAFHFGQNLIFHCHANLISLRISLR